MFDFSHLTPSRTAKFALHGVHVPRSNPQPVTLEVKSGGEDNAAYMGALRKTTLSADPTERLRQQASMIAKYVAVGWGGVEKPFRAAGEDSVEELLHALIAAKQGLHYLVPLLSFVGDPTNFREPLTPVGDLGNE